MGKNKNEKILEEEKTDLANALSTLSLVNKHYPTMELSQLTSILTALSGRIDQTLQKWLIPLTKSSAINELLLHIRENKNCFKNMAENGLYSKFKCNHVDTTRGIDLDTMLKEDVELEEILDPNKDRSIFKPDRDIIQGYKKNDIITEELFKNVSINYVNLREIRLTNVLVAFVGEYMPGAETALRKYMHGISSPADVSQDLISCLQRDIDILKFCGENKNKEGIKEFKNSLEKISAYRTDPVLKKFFNGVYTIYKECRGNFFKFVPPDDISPVTLYDVYEEVLKLLPAEEKLFDKISAAYLVDKYKNKVPVRDYTTSLSIRGIFKTIDKTIGKEPFCSGMFKDCINKLNPNSFPEVSYLLAKHITYNTINGIKTETEILKIASYFVSDHHIEKIFGIPEANTSHPQEICSVFYAGMADLLLKELPKDKYAGDKREKWKRELSHAIHKLNDNFNINLKYLDLLNLSKEKFSKDLEYPSS